MTESLTNQTDQLAHSSGPSDLEAVPLGVGNFEDEINASPLGDSGDRGRRIDTTSLLIAVVVIVAAGALFSMRKLATLAMPAEGNRELENKVESFVKSMSEKPTIVEDGNIFQPGNSTVLTVLNENYAKRQVQISDLSKNPFILPGTAIIQQHGEGPDNTVGPTPEELFQEARDVRLGVINEAASRFELKSVLMGNPPLANLNGKVVRVNEMIMVHPEEIEFTIAEITDGRVILTTRDEDYDLSTQIEVRLTKDQ